MSASRCSRAATSGPLEPTPSPGGGAGLALAVVDDVAAAVDDVLGASVVSVEPVVSALARPPRRRRASRQSGAGAGWLRRRWSQERAVGWPARGPPGEVDRG